MNKIVILLLAIGLLSVPAFAEEAADANGTAQVEAGENATVETLDDSAGAADVTVNESEVGAVPGDWNYGFKRFFENVDKFFTFDKSESAKKHAKYGLMRAMEAHVLSGKAQRLAAEGDEAGANSTLAEVGKLADEQTDELEEAESELESAVEDGSANETEVEQVQNATRNSIIVLQRVYEKAPEAAKDGLLRALNNSISNYERHVEKVEEKEMEREAKKAGSGDDNETDDGSDNETDTGKGNTGKDKNKTKTGDDGLSGNETESEDGIGTGTDDSASADGNETEVEDEDEVDSDTPEDPETNVTTGHGNGNQGKDEGEVDGEDD